VKAGFSEALVINSIRNAPRHSFTTTPAGLLELKSAGVTEAVILAMMAGSGSAAAPPRVATATPAPDRSAESVREIGIYYLHGSSWVDLLPDPVNWKTGGVLKSFATIGLVHGDINGIVRGATSRVAFAGTPRLLISAPEGTAPTEYQLLRLHKKSSSREFRTVTGGVLHSSAGATHGNLTFEWRKLGPRTYELLLPTLDAGEYGVLPPGASSSSSASAQLGKIYTFTVQ
jgi:hypothetical protein